MGPEHDLPLEQRDQEPTELERLAGWFDERTGLVRYARTTMRKVFPDHWSFLLGELALFCFVILVLTGIFLTFFFTADSRLMVYEGSYEPLRGQPVSAAFASVMNISFEVRAGLLVRQIHHWTALVFVGAIAVHMMRIFFTGAFRRPREINWLLGVTTIFLALAEGLTGYSLPDDLLSGTGMRIFDGAVMSIPFFGPNLAYLIFGGEFPTEFVISRLYVFHIFLLPALFVLVLTLHIGLIFLQKHTAYKDTGATEERVTGSYFWPTQVLRSLGLFLLTFGVLALIGGFFQINPVWIYGPYLPHVATVPAQPDWYLGWLEGALRLGLPIEPTVLGVTIPSAFVPALVLPGILFTIIVLWPWIERRLTGDREPHHILDWPWESPVRAATGAAVLSFFVVLTIAGANDVLAEFLQLNLELVTWGLRVALVAVPLGAWLIIYLLCRERLRRVTTYAGRPSGTPIRRGPHGGFVESDE